MSQIIHQIQIEAEPALVYQALTTEKGLRGWWTKEVEARPAAGSVAVFKFGGGATTFRMRIDELTQPQRIVWTCLGDVDEWIDTKMTWELTDLHGETDVHFTHAGWKSTAGMLPLCNTTWGALLYRLRSYCTTNKSHPLFE